MNALNQLFLIIRKNKNKSHKLSYTSYIFKKGINFSIKKFMEESKEFSTASKKRSKKNIIHEAADLLYHFLVLLEFRKISIISVMKELKKRQKISGIQEKKNRKINVR